MKNTFLYIKAAVPLIRRTSVSVWDFFVKWFLPVPALDEIRESDDPEESSQASKTAPPDKSDMPAPVPPVPPEPAPTIRAPEGAEDRAARGTVPNPFE